MWDGLNIGEIHRTHRTIVPKSITIRRHLVFSGTLWYDHFSHRTFIVLQRDVSSHYRKQLINLWTWTCIAVPDQLSYMWLSYVQASRISLTRPTVPSCKRTLMPWGCMEDFVRISKTVPSVSFPVRWSCFWKIFTCVPVLISERFFPFMGISSSWRNSLVFLKIRAPTSLAPWEKFPGGVCIILSTHISRRLNP